MTKRVVYSILAVFAAWAVLNFVIDGLILESAYARTPNLWRPGWEMKNTLLYFTILAAATVFVLIYDWYVADKSVERSVKYGLLFGVGTGISMGYGSYAVMPIPYSMAFVWFVGSAVKGAAAGWVMGLVMEGRGKRRGKPASAKGRRKTGTKKAGKKTARRA